MSDVAYLANWIGRRIADSINWVSRCIANIQSYCQNRRTRMNALLPADRAALSTSRATWVSAFFTLAVVVVGVFQSCTIQNQLNVMQRQMDDAEIQEAASISIKNFAIEGFPDNPQIVFQLLNAGRTRADQIGPVVNSGTIETKDELDFFIKPGLGINRPNINGFSLNPSEQKAFSYPINLFPFEVFTRDKSIPPDVLKLIQTRDDIVNGGQWTLYVRIMVPYLDVFKKQHQTSDCLIYRAQTKKFETCTAQHDRHE